ncbi:MAG: SCO family protein [Verrucomicrobiales bacterium]|jgi:protein SCO1/2|nr:SCO family protein [Verrucomicrobiales bacterium]
MISTKSKIVLVWLVALLLCGLIALASYFFFSRLQESSVRPAGTFKKVPDFEFTERTGKPFNSKELKGKIWVADFIFTRCPGQCLSMSRHFAQLQKILPKRDDVVLVSFSIDSNYDTPQILSNYADGYEAEANRWFFLTGDQEKIHQLVISGFLLPIAKTPEERVALEGGFTHSSRFVVIDREGNIRSYVEGLSEDSPKDTLAAIHALLKE